MIKQPSQIGHYTIERELGRGSTSVVYLATDTQELRQVALKVLDIKLADNPMVLKRFQRRGENTKKLSHPNIINVYEVGEVDGYHYIAMEYMPNGTLDDLIDQRRGPLLDREVITILEQVANGLDHAHSQGYLHLDINPSDILFAEDGRVVITDFGVAKDLTDDVSKLTTAGMAVGTPAFMSPEQARGESNIDSRSDIYSLGVVAYTMLTGRMPFEAESELALLRKIADEAPSPPERFNPRINAGAAYVLKVVLCKTPDDRYATAGDFFTTLRYQLMLSPPTSELGVPTIPMSAPMGDASFPMPRPVPLPILPSDSIWIPRTIFVLSVIGLIVYFAYFYLSTAYVVVNPTPIATTSTADATATAVAIAGLIQSPTLALTLTPTPTLTQAEALDKAVEELPEGKMVFNAPSRMRTGGIDRVVARVIRDTGEEVTQALLEGIAQEGRVTATETIKVNTEMKAELTASSANAFAINPLSESTQLVAQQEYTEWLWDVTALRSGTYTLTLKVAVIVEIPGYDSKMRSTVVEKNMTVEVDLVFLARSLWENNWQWFLAPLLLLLIWVPITLINSRIFPSGDQTIKILFLAANTMDQTRLKLDEESRAIDKSLREAEYRVFHLEKQFAVRIEELAPHLLRYKPTIVHFCGHGSPSGINLLDETGQSRPLSAQALDRLFAPLRGTTRVVVLNSCYSSSQAPAIAKHVDCVVGMSNTVLDRAAIKFAAAFYSALGYGEDVKTAHNLGCVQGSIVEGNDFYYNSRILSVNNNPSTITLVAPKSHKLRELLKRLRNRFWLKQS